MKSPITKLAAAAVIAVVILGLLEFIGTRSTSGVVWAEVAKKIEASRGVIFRRRGTNSGDYSMFHLSETQKRFDFYEGDEIARTSWSDFDAGTFVFVAHDTKKYLQKTLSEEEQQGGLANPKSWVQGFLSCEYRKLGKKTIDGALCEGIETTDPNYLDDNSNPNFTVDSLVAQVWVSVETGYPVLLELECDVVLNNDQLHATEVLDQFQWDVELDASIFEPNIPSDYEPM